MMPLLPVLLNRRGRIILITMHVGSLVCLSREARCQEAQVFPTIEGGCSSLDCINRPLAFLPPQHPVSPRGVLASHPGCLPPGEKNWRGLREDAGSFWTALRSCSAPPESAEAVGPPGAASAPLPSVSYRGWARSCVCGHNRTGKSFCQ